MNRNRKPKINMVLCEREGCLNLFNKAPDRRKLYCSRSCSASVNNKRFPKRTPGPAKSKPLSVAEKWLAGDFDGTVKTGLSSAVRNYLLEQAQYKCQNINCCVVGGWSGFNPASGRSALTVDHIDGNYLNNHASNLLVLCPNCHSLTPTYGALNKGNGRSSRYAPVT